MSAVSKSLFVICSGELSGNASFGSLYTSQSSGVDFFVSEVSSTGGWADLVHAGGIGLERATSVIHSGQGSLYVAGITSAGLTLGNDVLADLDGINDDWEEFNERDFAAKKGSA